MQQRTGEQGDRRHGRGERGTPRGTERRDRNPRQASHYEEDSQRERHFADEPYGRDDDAQRFGDDPFDRAFGRPAYDGDRERGDFGSYGSDRQRRDLLEQDPQRYGASEWRRRFGGADWQQPNYAGSGHYGGAERYGDVSGSGRGTWGGLSDDGSSQRARTPYESAGGVQGGHQGKGPKGYRRADERVIDDVCQALENDSHVDASEIEVSCQQGEVVLKGNVDSREAKRRAEQCIEDLPGVKDVRNELRVQTDARPQEVRTSGRREEGTGATSRNGR